MKSIRYIFLVIPALLWGLSTTHAQVCDCAPTTNLVTNGDFSNGTTGFTSDFTNSSSCTPNTYSVEAEARDKCAASNWINDLWDNTSGNAEGRYMVISGDVFNWETAWSNSTPINVQSGQTYTFSFWNLPSVTTSFSFQYLEVRIDGSLVGSVNTAPASQNDWTQYCFTWLSNTTGSVTIEIRALSGNGGGRDYGIDDIHFSECTLQCTVDADIFFTNTGACAYDFTSSVTTGSTTSIVGYYWEFGDGNTSTEASPQHSYLDPGTYTVCLTTYGLDEAGACCLSKTCEEVNVACERGPCAANLSDIAVLLLPDIGPGGHGPCEFRLNLNISGVNRPIIGYFWDFGDGTTAISSTNSIIHEFPSSGFYEVCATVVLRSGADECCTFQYCESVEISCQGGEESSGPEGGGEFNKSSLTEDQHSALIGLFPNPGTDQLNIVLNTEHTEEATVTITSVDGKQVLNRPYQLGGGAFTSVDVAHLPTGMYVIQVETRETRLVKNWIKQ